MVWRNVKQKHTVLYHALCDLHLTLTYQSPSFKVYYNMLIAQANSEDSFCINLKNVKELSQPLLLDLLRVAFRMDGTRKIC